MSSLQEFRPASNTQQRLKLPRLTGLRTAQVSPRVAPVAEARIFSVAQLPALRSFAPQVLVGSCSDLEDLAKRLNEKDMVLGSLDRALFVITDCHDVPLRDCSRVVLWQAFGVPIYEVLLGGDGLPVAFECDAHDGWHVATGVSFATHNGQLWFRRRKRDVLQGTGLLGDVEPTPCPCGERGARILNARMDFRDPIRQQLAQSA